LGATLNWRRDPDYERRMNALAIRIQQTENEILRVESDNGRIENDILQVESEIVQIENDIVQIEKETEQLRRENAKLKTYNAKMKHFISYVDQLCFPAESSSTLPPATENDCGSSSP
jgi:predicted  nucleic acid-binding Zn-ribbon protein